MPVEVPWELVPDTDPSSTPQALDRASSIEDMRARRAFLWTTALVDEASQHADLWRAGHRPPQDLPWMAAGFVPLPTNLTAPVGTKSERGFVFGLCLIPSLSGGSQAPSFVRFLAVSGIKFPVFRLPGSLNRHLPTHPTGPRSGTAACWATPTPGGKNPTGLPGSGVLTAAHVAVASAPVSGMIPATPYGVIGYAIDAIVMYPDAYPAHASRLRVRRAATVGTNVDVHLKSGTRSATILLTFQPSAYVGFPCPHRMIIDQSFVPGDSGALVTDPGSTDAMGLYIGVVTAASGSIRGVCQLMEQVTTELALDLYL